MPVRVLAVAKSHEKTTSKTSQVTKVFDRTFFQTPTPVLDLSQSLGRGCDEALFSEKRVFSEKGGGNSVNGRFGKDFYRNGNSVKRSGPFSEPQDSEN